MINMSKTFYCCRQLAILRIAQGICLSNMLLWPVYYKQVFLVIGWWATVDFYSKYKILWGETRDHGVPIHERKKTSKKEST